MDKIIRTIIQAGFYGECVESLSDTEAHLANDYNGRLQIYINYKDAEHGKTIVISRDDIFELFAIDGVMPSDSYAKFLAENEAEWKPES